MPATNEKPMTGGSLSESPGSAKWTVSTHIFGHLFTSAPLPRAEAEKLQDEIEDNGRILACLDRA